MYIDEVVERSQTSDITVMHWVGIEEFVNMFFARKCVVTESLLKNEVQQGSFPQSQINPGWILVPVHLKRNVGS